MKIIILILCLMQTSFATFGKITLHISKSGGGILGYGRIEQTVQHTAVEGDCIVTLMCSLAGTSQCKTDNAKIFKDGCQVIVKNDGVGDWFASIDSDIGQFIANGTFSGTMERNDISITRPGTTIFEDLVVVWTFDQSTGILTINLYSESEL